MDLDAVGDFAQDLADRAVAVVRDLDPGPIQRKKDGTLVTEVDLAINSMVIEQVTQHWPEHGVLGEEESFQLGTDWLWVCDPLDGTFPFRVGIQAANFSLALCYRGAPQVAVIADPFANQRWFARTGRGCQYNGVPASVSDATSLATAGIDL